MSTPPLPPLAAIVQDARRQEEPRQPFDPFLRTPVPRLTASSCETADETAGSPLALEHSIPAGQRPYEACLAALLLVGLGVIIGVLGTIAAVAEANADHDVPTPPAIDFRETYPPLPAPASSPSPTPIGLGV